MGGGIQRRFETLLVLLASLAGLLLASTGPAHAAPQPAPMTVTISGDELGATLVVQANDPALFTALVDQVSWLRGTGQGDAPKEDDLGRKYILEVEYKGAAKQTYHLYPLAKGGPRACRPGGPQSGDAAWFYGRLNMSDTLRAAGVPLPDHAESITGGIGGGEGLAAEAEIDPAKGLDQILGDLRQLMLLNAGIVLALTIGIAGIALLIRHRTR